MRRLLGSILFGLALCTLSGNAPGDLVADAGVPLEPVDAQWSLHVLYRPGGQETRLVIGAEDGPVPVRAPWQCAYKRTTIEQQDIVKIKCMHDRGAVVGTVAMCRRESGQSDMAQLSIGVDGVAAYETIDLSCAVPLDRGRVYDVRH